MITPDKEQSISEQSISLQCLSEQLEGNVYPKDRADITQTIGQLACRLDRSHKLDTRLIQKLQLIMMALWTFSLQDSSSDGQKIHSWSRNVFQHLGVRLHREVFQVAQAAAARGQADTAKRRLQAMQEELSKKRASESGKKIEQAREKLKNEANRLQKELQATVLEVTKNRAEEAKEKEKLIPFEKLNPEERAKQSAQEQLLKAEIERLRQVRIASQWREIDLTKEYAKVKEQLLVLGKSTVLQQSDTRSRNAIFIQKGKEFVFKMQSPELENRAQMVCELLGAPHAIHPTAGTSIPGAVEYFRNGYVYQEDRTNGTIQPLIDRAVSYYTIAQNTAFMSEVEARLNTADSQQKIVVQALLDALDLHSSNAFCQLIPNEAYTNLDQYSWEYRDDPKSDWKLASLFELTCLKFSGTIKDQTHVRRTDQPFVERSIEMAVDLQQAFQSDWQLVMFDNEETVGGAKNPATGNPNHFYLWNSKPCLPLRCFLLGRQISQQPLTPETAQFLLDLPQRRPYLERTLSQGNDSLWRHLSLEVQNELKCCFQLESFYFTYDAAKGAGKHDLFSMLPPALVKKVLSELEKKKIIPPLPTHPTNHPKYSLDYPLALQTLRKEVSALGAFLISKKLIQQDYLERVLENIDKSCDLLSIYLNNPEIIAQPFRAKARHLYIPIGNTLTKDECEICNLLQANVKNASCNVVDMLNACGIPQYKAAIATLFNKWLYPEIAPQELKALLERQEKATQYVIDCNKNVYEFLSVTQNLQKHNFDLKHWTKEQSARLTSGLDKAVQLINQVAHIGPEVLFLHMAAVNNIKKQLKSAIAEGHLSEASFDTCQTVLNTTHTYLQPTTYGLVCQMYPHVYFIVNLQVQIEANNRKLQNPTALDFHAIRNDLLFEKTAVTLPHTRVKNGLFRTTPALDIMNEAVKQGIIVEANPFYQAALHDLQSCKPR